MNCKQKTHKPSKQKETYQTQVTATQVLQTSRGRFWPTGKLMVFETMRKHALTR